MENVLINALINDGVVQLIDFSACILILYSSVSVDMMKQHQHQNKPTLVIDKGYMALQKPIRTWLLLIGFLLSLFPVGLAIAESNTGEYRYPVLAFEEGRSVENIQKLKQDFPLLSGVAEQYEDVVYTAISFFPELKTTPIVFVHANRKWPLTSQPFFSDVLKPFGQRCYRIIVSEQSSQNLEPVLLKNLPFNAQIGAIGHELGHIADFQKKSNVQLMANGLLYWTGLGRKNTEQSADRITIEHGLGYQLYDWSSHVRNVMGDNDWVVSNRVFKSTYTSPSSILTMIETLPIYHGLK